MLVASLIPAMPLPCAKEASDAGSIRIKKIAFFFIGFAVW